MQVWLTVIEKGLDDRPAMLTDPRNKFRFDPAARTENVYLFWQVATPNPIPDCPRGDAEQLGSLGYGQYV
jgi:hypothetical protein